MRFNSALWGPQCPLLQNGANHSPPLFGLMGRPQEMLGLINYVTEPGVKPAPWRPR